MLLGDPSYWLASFMTKCLAGDYDEERRLFYVAMTRAKQYLTLTAETGNESKFFSESTTA